MVIPDRRRGDRRVEREKTLKDDNVNGVAGPALQCLYLVQGQ